MSNHGKPIPPLSQKRGDTHLYARYLFIRFTGSISKVVDTLVVEVGVVVEVKRVRATNKTTYFQMEHSAQ